jgi:tetratricopeptide (TPR) repeat protein
MSSEVPSRESLTLSLPAAQENGTLPTLTASPGTVQIPGYELLEEVGRGGMGVVYRARDQRLGRVVALKMILAGGHAGAEELARFRTEAEAIARLQHPGIVQVFEVGEHEGRPFLSLEYCAGGSLEKWLDGTPHPPRQAAELVRALAVSIDTAHQANIIHRDLKPANVLLSVVSSPLSVAATAEQRTTDNGQRNILKITDFGLAKKLDVDAGATQTGAIMGTPSYMAPEQAQGEKHVGPAVDIYALGAILYECLTGRAPFKAPTPFETLAQVVADEPVPPRRLVRGTPRDLETICLKCLHKAPARRYASAGELADDLGRYLDGQPVLARPVSRLERGVKWVARRPAAAGLIGVSIAALLLLAGVTVTFVLRLQEQKTIAEGAREQADLKAREAEDARTETERQRWRAQQNEKHARAVVDIFTSKAINDPRLHEPGLADIRREWLNKAQELYKVIAMQSGNNLELRTEQAKAFSQLVMLMDEGDNADETEKTYARARELWELLIQENPKRAEFRKELASLVASRAGPAQKKHQPKRAETYLLEALRLHEDLARREPGKPEYQGQVAATINNLALFYKDTGDLARAREHFNKALAMIDTLPGDAAGPLELDGLRAMVLINLSGLFQNEGKIVEAERSANLARDDLARLRKTKKTTGIELVQMDGLLSMSLAVIYNKTGRDRKAREALQTCIAAWQELVDKQPHVTGNLDGLASVLMFYSLALRNAGEIDEAEPLLYRAAAIQDQLYRLRPKDDQFRRNRVSGLSLLGEMYMARRQAGPAETTWRRYIAACREMLADGKDPEIQRKLALGLQRLQTVYQNTGQYDRALAEHREEKKLFEQALQDRPKDPIAMADLAGSCCNFGIFLGPRDPQAALREYDRGIALLDRALAAVPDHEQTLDYLGKTLSNRAGLFRDLGRTDAEMKDHRRLLKLAEAAVRRAPRRIEASYTLATRLNGAGHAELHRKRFADAEKLFLREAKVLDDLVRGHGAGSNESRERFAGACVTLATFYRDKVPGRDADAQRWFRRAIVHNLRLSLLAPEKAGHLVHLGGNLCDLGQMQKDRPASLTLYDCAESALAAALSLQPRNETAERFLRNTRASRARILSELGRVADAVADQKLVVAHDRKQAGRQEATLDDQVTLVSSMEKLARLGRLGEEDLRADDVLAEAIERCERLRIFPAFPSRVRPLLANLYHERGRVQGARGEFKRSLPLWERERELRERLLQEQPGNVQNLYHLTECLKMLAAANAIAARLADAAAVQRDLIKRYEQLIAARPDYQPAALALPQAYQHLGTYTGQQKEHKASAAAFQRAAQLWEKMLKSLPAEAARGHVRTVASCYGLLGEVLGRMERWSDSEKANMRAIELYERARQAEPKDSALAVEFAGCACNQAHALQVAGKEEAALPLYTRAIEALDGVLENGDAKQRETAMQYLRNSHWGHGLTFSRQGKLEPALAELDRAVLLDRAGPQRDELMVERSRILALLGRHDRATQSVMKLFKGKKPEARVLYQGACVYALSAAAVRKDDTLPLPARDRLAELHARRSLQLLDEARWAGYFQTEAKRKTLHTDRDLGELRDRDDFRKWIAGVSDGAVKK